MENEIPDYYAKLPDLTDREILFMVVEKLRYISKNQSNHLKHHWAITLICCAAALTGIFNIGIALMIIFVKG